MLFKWSYVAFTILICVNPILGFVHFRYVLKYYYGEQRRDYWYTQIFLSSLLHVGLIWQMKMIFLQKPI